MRRSEAVKLMTNEYAYLSRGGWCEATDEEKMDKILYMLEQVGLKPPVTKFCPVLLTTEHVWQKEEQNDK